MFKRKLLSVLVTTAAVGFGGFTMNASASDGTGVANAEIVAPIAITEGTAMDFGSVSGDSDPLNGSTVDLDVFNTVTPSALAAVVPASGAASASFDVTGVINVAYDIALPAAAVTITSGGGDTMTVTNFVDSAGGSSTLDGTGADSFEVGARLNISGNQAVGVYSGNYTMTVTYQ